MNIKIKKKLTACATAMALFSTSAIPVFATESTGMLEGPDGILIEEPAIVMIDETEQEIQTEDPETKSMESVPEASETAESSAHSESTSDLEAALHEKAAESTVTDPVPSVTANGITTVSLGYFFEDGSFDPWAESPGFVCGEVILTGTQIKDRSKEGNAYQTALQERAAAYTAVGIDLADYESVSGNIGWGTLTGDRYVRLYPVSMGDTPYMAFTGAGNAGGIMLASEDPKPNDTLTILDPDGEKTVTVSEVYNNGAVYMGLTGAGDAFKTGLPVIDADGNAAGIITGATQGGLTAVTASSVAAALDKADIEYALAPLKGDGSGNTGSGDDAAYDELNRLVLQAESIDVTGMTQESADALKDAFVRARQALDTGEGLDTAKQDLENAINGLTAERKLDTALLAKAGILGASVIMIIAAIIILLRMKKKPKYIIEGEEEPRRKKTPKPKKEKKNRRAKRGQDDAYDIDEPVSREMSDDRDARETRRARTEETVPGEKERGKNSAEQVINEVSEKETPQADIPVSHKDKEPEDRFGSVGRFGSPVPAKEEKPAPEEDTRMNDEDDEEADTSLLSEKLPKASILRKLDGRTIPVTRNAFVIGKSSKETDCRIRGNSAISRRHARIDYADGAFTLTDLTSKNGTYINDAKLEPGRATPLHDGDVITLADEEFNFHEEDES